jgi:hypothetical protein
VCFAALDDPTKFKQPISSVLGCGDGTRIDFRNMCDITTEHGGWSAAKSCQFPILIHESKKDSRIHSEQAQNQADMASVAALVQQKYFDMRLPLYQIVLEGKSAGIMRCWWDEKDGVPHFNRTVTYSPAWPEGHYFDLTRPAEMLECFLIVVNILKYLPDVYAKSAFDFQREVFSGTWQANRLSDANMISLMLSPDK